MRQRDDRLGDLMSGVLAGIVATWVMGRVTTALYEREDVAAREREDAARDGRTAYEVAAEKGAALVGTTLSEEDRKKAGEVIHWALGAGAGAAYAALRGRVPGADAGAGLAYGLAFFLVVDEAGTAAIGLTPGPRAFPWQTHARGLLGHLAFGTTAEITLRMIDRFR